MQSLVRYCTRRLLAERLDIRHFAELCRMHQDQTVMATLGGIRSEEKTQQYLDINLNHWDTHGFGLWVFRDKANHQFVGRGGLRHAYVDGNDEVEVAYALMSDYWGRD